MPHHLHKLFAEHEKPTHASKADVQAQLGAIIRLGTSVLKQTLEDKALVTEAQLADETGELHAKYEHLHQTFGASEREAQALVAAGRNLLQTYIQRDRYIAEAKVDMNRLNPATPSAPAAEVADGAQAAQ